jgi:hypothetical protein
MYMHNCGTLTTFGMFFPQRARPSWNCALSTKVRKGALYGPIRDYGVLWHDIHIYFGVGLSDSKY